MSEDQEKSIVEQRRNRFPVGTTVAIILMMVCSAILTYFYNVNLCVNTNPYGGCMGCQHLYTECAMIISLLPLSLLLFSLLLLWKKSKWMWWGCIVVLFINAVSLSLMSDARYIDGYAEELYIYIPIILLLVASVVLLIVDRRRYFEYTSLKRRFERYLRLLALFLFIGFIVYFGAYINSIPCWGPRQHAYDISRYEVQTSVVSYMIDNDEMMPTLNSTVSIGGSDYRIVDVCVLLVADWGMLSEGSISCISINGSDNDNCDAGCEGCQSDYHYVWAVDDEDNVYSTCVGDDCEANGEDGFQGVWP